jgi:hypothetical protein
MGERHVAEEMGRMMDYEFEIPAQCVREQSAPPVSNRTRDSLLQGDGWQNQQSTHPATHIKRVAMNTFMHRNYYFHHDDHCQVIKMDVIILFLLFLLTILFLSNYSHDYYYCYFYYYYYY